MKELLGHKRYFLLLFLSGVLAACILFKAVFLLCWIAYVPFFILLERRTTASLVAASIAFSLGLSAVGFFWMLSSAASFTGNNWFYGAVVLIISIAIFTVYWISLIYFFSSLKRAIKSIWIKAFLVASSFVIAEYILMLAFVQMPYYLFSSGYPLLENLYTIQWTSIFGLPILSFVVVVINYLIAQIIISKQWLKLVSPSVIALSVLFGGFLLKRQVDSELIEKRPLIVAIAAENIPANLRWDEKGGNILAQRLLTLSERAAALKPDIIVWSETTIPWPYAANDNLLQQLLRAPYPANATHLLGFMTNYTEKRMYNSVYGIAANGKLLGRYDKKYLLDFVETPLLGLNMPFRDLDGYLIEEGRSDQPIKTPAGKAGIVICNEVVKPEASSLMVKNGAEFLLNLSNDGWFKNSNIVNLHFLYAKLAAVINRKDLVVNSNNGISGAIKANGEVLLKRKSDDIYVEQISISINSYDNSKRHFPDFIPILCSIVVLAAFSSNIYKKYHL